MTVPVSVFVTVPASMAVTSTAVTVPVRMTVKQKKTQQVDDETGDAHVQHPVLVFNFLIIGQPLDRLHENGEAECDQEYGIHESANYFCPRPAVSIFLGMKLWYLKYTKIIAYNTESKYFSSNYLRLHFIKFSQNQGLGNFSKTFFFKLMGKVSQNFIWCFKG